MVKHRYYPAIFSVNTYSMDRDQTVMIEAVWPGSTLSCLCACIVKILASLGSGRLKPMPLDFEEAVIFAGALGAFTIHILKYLFNLYLDTERKKCGSIYWIARERCNSKSTIDSDEQQITCTVLSLSLRCQVCYAGDSSNLWSFTATLDPCGINGLFHFTSCNQDNTFKVR